MRVWLSAAADITQMVAILQVKIIPTSAAAEEEKINEALFDSANFLFAFLHQSQ
jgi:hypothetical protein